MKRFYVAGLALASGLALAPSPVRAQKVDTYSPQQLMQEAKPLKEQADQANGLASKILEKYPDHYTMLAFREKNGQAELHKDSADVMFVLEGNATLVTGGSVLNPKTTGPGEVRGDSVQGGTSVKLSKGSVAHIPANVPHQLLIPAGHTFTYFIVKADTSK
jgi:mannose-6-phosphate isomerase-like protein (cupin superfamily)